MTAIVDDGQTDDVTASGVCIPIFTTSDTLARLHIAVSAHKAAAGGQSSLSSWLRAARGLHNAWLVLSVVFKEDGDDAFPQEAVNKSYTRRHPSQRTW